MQYSFVNACLLALATTSSVVVAQTAFFDVINKPANLEVVPALSTYTITWTPSAPAGPITIQLLQGATQGTLVIGDTIAKSIDSTLGKFTWTTPKSSFPLYGIKLSLDSDPTTFQYSHPFTLSEDNTKSSSSSSSSSGSISSSVAGGSTTTIKVSQVSTLPSTTATTSSTTSYVATSSTTTTSAVVTTTAIPTTSSTTFVTVSSSPTPTPASNGTVAAPTPTKVGNSAVSNAVIGGSSFFGAIMLSIAMLL